MSLAHQIGTHQALGYLALRHGAEKVLGGVIPAYLRGTVRAGRIVHPDGESATLADVGVLCGWHYWPARGEGARGPSERGERGVWSSSLPAVVTTSPAFPAPPLRLGPAGTTTRARPVLTGQSKLTPVHSRAVGPDVRLEEVAVAAPLFGARVWPVGQTGIVTAGTDEDEQGLAFHPDWLGLVAPTRGGDPRAGTPIWDVTAAGRLDPATSAQLQQLVEVVPFAPGSNVPALVLGPARIDAAPGGLHVVDNRWGTVGALDSELGGPFVVGDPGSGAIGTFRSGASGGPACRHTPTRYDANGRAVLPVHIHRYASIMDEEGRDGPIASGRGEWVEIPPDPAAGGGTWQECYLRFDPRFGPTGSWRIQTQTPIVLTDFSPFDATQPPPFDGTRTRTPLGPTSPRPGGGGGGGAPQPFPQGPRFPVQPRPNPPRPFPPGRPHPIGSPPPRPGQPLPPGGGGGGGEDQSWTPQPGTVPDDQRLPGSGAADGEYRDYNDDGIDDRLQGDGAPPPPPGAPPPEPPTNQNEGTGVGVWAATPYCLYAPNFGWLAPPTSGTAIAIGAGAPATSETLSSMPRAATVDASSIDAEGDEILVGDGYHSSTPILTYRPTAVRRYDVLQGDYATGGTKTSPVQPIRVQFPGGLATIEFAHPDLTSTTGSGQGGRISQAPDGDGVHINDVTATGATGSTAIEVSSGGVEITGTLTNNGVPIGSAAGNNAIGGTGALGTINLAADTSYGAPVNAAGFTLGATYTMYPGSNKPLVVKSTGTTTINGTVSLDGRAQLDPA